MSAVDLSVVGLGLVSPLGLTPRDHVFFIRAEGGLCTARAFVDAEGEPLDVLHCQWLDPALPLGERLLALSRQALSEAAEPLWSAGTVGGRLKGLGFCARPYEALPQGEEQHFLAQLSEALPLSLSPPLLYGAAAFFKGLERAQQLLQQGEPAVALWAADSHCSAAVLERRLRRYRDWERTPSFLAEAAAAVVVTLRGRERGLPSLGHISFAGAEMDRANDDNEAIVDGAAMTKLVRQAAASGITQSFGPHNVDSLRSNSWGYAVTRSSGRFDELLRQVCVEDDLGLVGAAAGAVHLCYGLAVELHQAAPDDLAKGPFAAWAISRDGLNGLAIGKGPPR